MASAPRGLFTPHPRIRVSVAADETQQRVAHAILDGEPAGVLITRDPKDRPWVAWLGVAKATRGNGVAKHLLLTAFDTLRARGRHTVGVDTDTHNATDAVRVYQRAGMVSQGTADAWAPEL
ncbi:MAG TPA: GNAT family N-acetyltransferase [Pseudonocardiaceae bacterium]